MAAGNGGLQFGTFNPQAISPGRQRLLVEALDALATGELDMGLNP